MRRQLNVNWNSNSKTELRRHCVASYRLAISMSLHPNVNSYPGENVTDEWCDAEPAASQ